MNETQNTETQRAPLDRRVLAIAAFLVVVVGGGIAALAYLTVSSRMVYIEKARIEAPVVNLAPIAQGTLRALNVSAGQVVPPQAVVAQVGVELIKSTQGGLVLATHGDVGKLVNPGETVVEMIDPAQLRVVGQLQEDKGLADVHVGQVAKFTVDAFGSETFTGVVEEISPTASTGDVVFSISDKRQERDFNVKIKYDTTALVQFKQGMSAKIWVYKDR